MIILPSDVTLLIQRWREGDESAFHELLPLVYAELNRLARILLSHQRPGHTLQPTALVHEACLKLLEHPNPQITNRPHFLAVLSRAMRQVLIDHAKTAAAGKRGGGARRVTFDPNFEVAGAKARPVHILELDEVLNRLDRENPRLCRLVEMHYFGGMTAEESAEATGQSPDSVRHGLRAARAWLKRELTKI
jgi:RNA polymerase sigma factor (TIGR02999 family)